MDTVAKRVKLQHLLDFSSDPPSFACSNISSATTQKVFLSWCKDERKEIPRVIEFVGRLRKKLWEKGIEVFDTDVERHVKKERYIPILIGTISYFNDVECLNHLKVICQSHQPHHLLPIFYDPDGELRRFFNRFKRGPEWEKPILIPLDTPWSPPPDDDDDVNDDDGSGDGDVVDVDDDVDHDDSEDVYNDHDEDIEDVVGDEGKDDAGDDNDDAQDERKEDAGDRVMITEEEEEEEEEEELTLGLALIHLSCFIEWLREPIINDPKAECDFIDHYVLLVWLFLNPADVDYTSLVGLQSRLDCLHPYLFSAKESLYIAISGPEGSGKTTTAKFLYNMFCTVHPSFHHTRMISNPTSLSLKELAVKVFGETCGYSSGASWNPEEHQYTTESYEHWPLLIIFDNINNVDDFNHVAPVLSLLPENGSKVVFTTRDVDWLKRLLPPHRYKTHLIQSLDAHSSLELFCLKAFKQNQPPKHYKKLADNVVNMAKGIPLDLVYCASQFCLLSKDDNWTVALENNEDMDRLFWSKYVPRAPKPITTGSCQPKSERKSRCSFSFETTPMCMKKHQHLLVQIMHCMEASTLDCEIDRGIVL